MKETGFVSSQVQLEEATSGLRISPLSDFFVFVRLILFFFSFSKEKKSAADSVVFLASVNFFKVKTE